MALILFFNKTFHAENKENLAESDVELYVRLQVYPHEFSSHSRNSSSEITPARHSASFALAFSPQA